MKNAKFLLKGNICRLFPSFVRDIKYNKLNLGFKQFCINVFFVCLFCSVVVQTSRSNDAVLIDPQRK